MREMLRMGLHVGKRSVAQITPQLLAFRAMRPGVK